MKAFTRYHIILLGDRGIIGVNNLPRVAAWQCTGRESNPRPSDHKSDALTITLPSHQCVSYTQGSLELANVYMDNSEWELIGVQLEHRRRLGVDAGYRLDVDDDERKYTELSYTVHIRRRSLYYTFNVIVPCVMLSSLTLLTFCLPSNSREKIGLGLTVFLTFSMFMLLIAEVVPTTSESVPLIG